MLSLHRIRLIAIAALASFAFAQAAIAAMGCATLRPASARENIAIMPSGEPCDMMGSTPAPLCMKWCAQDAAASDPGASSLAALPLLTPVAIAALTDNSSAMLAKSDGFPPILGPPPYLATLRLRV